MSAIIKTYTAVCPYINLKLSLEHFEIRHTELFRRHSMARRVRGGGGGGGDSPLFVSQQNL